MRLQIITGTSEEYENAMPGPQNEAECTIYYREILEQAAADKEEWLHLRSVPVAGKPSDHFALVGAIERMILDFLMTNDYPGTVCIVCDSDTSAQTYKTVYNFWFAGDRFSRMDDTDGD